MIDWSDRVAPSFRWSELVTGESDQIIGARRHALAADSAAVRAATQLAETLQWVRDLVGAPVRVTSGYRGPTRTGSQHDTGHAADIQVDGLTPLQLLGMLHAAADHSPHPLRQCIAESLHTDAGSLSRPMAKGSGLWVHAAIGTGEWARPSTRPWATSIAPTSGPRLYRTWRPS